VICHSGSLVILIILLCYLTLMWQCSNSEFLSDINQQNVIMFLLSFCTVCYRWQTDSVNCWCLQRSVWLRTFATTATWRSATCLWPAKMMRSCIGSCLKLWTSWASARKSSLVSDDYNECSVCEVLQWNATHCGSLGHMLHVVLCFFGFLVIFSTGYLNM